MQRAADSLVLLDPSNGKYFALDDVGAQVWELCDGTRDIPAIVAAICAEYEAEPTQVEADVRELLAELETEGLVDEPS